MDCLVTHKKIICIFLYLQSCICFSVFAQEKGHFSGDLQLNAKFFQADSARAAINTPFYDYLFYGAESWLQLNYGIAGFNMGLRLDLFQNSNIFTPTLEVSEQGIGRWYISKTIDDKLSFTGGYIYDQYGSGFTLRAYEGRPLGIDQAIVGLSVGYKFNDNWRLRAITGKRKNLFALYRPVIKGVCLEGRIPVGKITLLPGASVVNRTIDTQTMESIAQELNGSPLADRFVPKYNTYATSVFNTLEIGNFSWYAELAHKTEDVLRDLDGKLIHPKNGYVGYTSLSYSQKGLGIILQAKYTKDFEFRVSPNERQNRGLINFQPPLANQNSYRLTTRYAAVTQFLGEAATQLDVNYTPKKGITLGFNYADTRNLDAGFLGLAADGLLSNNGLFYRELYVNTYIKLPKKPWKMDIGVQMVDYNQAVFEQKGDFVNTFTPFTEFTYKFNPKHSLKTEFSYMMTERNRRLFGRDLPVHKQDLGDWLWGLAEYNISPNWSFALSDMYNLSDKLHFPTIFAAYSRKSSRFALSYAKQPAGIICTGGVCRFEPAFSGVRFDLNTTF